MNLKVVVAPDSFKGSLTASEACDAIENGLLKVFPDADIIKVPMADGGEGTVRSLVDATGGKVVSCRVTGPLGEQTKAFYGILGDGTTAVIEMASASGLPLVPKDRKNPCFTTTYGTGELIKAAMDRGCRRLIIGIGGSATNDGGVGMAEAVGVKFLDANGSQIKRGGGFLSDLDRIDMSGLDMRVKEAEFVVACDVDNPLTGPRGASAVYGPQKGATPEMVQILDRGLYNLARVIKKDVGVDVNDIPGSGAAGGLGAGLIAFTSAELKKGIEIVIETTGLKEKLQGADLVITGEGKTDFQTLFGKTPIGVANCAKENDIPVVIISGGYSEDALELYEHGIDALTTIVKGPCSVDDAIKRAGELMRDAAESVARKIKIGMNMSCRG